MNMSDIFCNFVQVDENTYECSKCGNIITAQDDSNEIPIFPCYFMLASHDASNIRNFISTKNSDDLSSIDLIESRHKICSSCEFFDKNSCLKCGCNLTKDRNYLNKIAHINEHCPINKW